MLNEEQLFDTLLTLKCTLEYYTKHATLCVLFYLVCEEYPFMQNIILWLFLTFKSNYIFNIQLRISAVVNKKHYWKA